MNPRNFSPRSIRRSRRAFTLIEVLVALGILAILLAIIVLPLRLGFDSFNKGNAQTLTQSAVQATLTDMENDIRQSVYVFPNARVAGITDKEPYVNKDATGTVIPADSAELPYYISTDATDTAEPGKGAPGNPSGIACSTNSKPWSNPSTLSMIQVRRDTSGNVLTPLAPSYNIVTYYARRQQLSKPYDPVDNPIVMYRAEYPAFGLLSDGSPAPLAVQSPAGAFNAKIDFKRVLPASTSCTSAAAVGNRSSLWLSHNYYGEADLLPLTQVGKMGAPPAFQPTGNYDLSSLNASYSQTLATPRGLALEASNGYRTMPDYTGTPASIQGALVPDTTFTTTDTNGDGKIDRVTISLGLASFDVGAQGQLDPVTFQPKGTILRGTRTIDLPNIK